MEEYRIINNFEDYKVSNFGNVMSLKNNKEKILSPSLHYNGYLSIVLSIKGKLKTFKVHQLVAMAFLNHEPCGLKIVINHKDFNKKNNNVDNLELVTPRENSNRKHLKSTSKYTGVYWHTRDKRWRASIVINKKNVYLGSFKIELEASNAYQKALKNLQS